MRQMTENSEHKIIDFTKNIFHIKLRKAYKEAIDMLNHVALLLNNLFADL